MRTLPVYHRFRVLLKYLHIVSAGLWLGSGACVLLLLYLSTGTAKGDELYAFTLAVLCIDNCLLVPAACLCFLSGVAICGVEGMCFFTCGWVMGKCIGSVAALAIGSFFMVHWMALLSKIVDIERIKAMQNLDYLDIWRADVILGIVQTCILLSIIYIAIKRPCVNFKNCKQCRESGSVPRTG
jgi:uncharacterized membrane protein